MIIVIAIAPTIKQQNKPDLNIINVPFKFISFNTSGLHPAVSVICGCFPGIPVLGICTYVCWISSSVLNVNSWISDKAAAQSWDLYRRILQQDSSLTGLPRPSWPDVPCFRLDIVELKLPFDRWVGDMKVESVGNRLWEIFDSSNGNLPFFTRRGSLSLPVFKIKPELKTHGCDTPGENPRCSDGSGQNGLPGYDLKQAASLEVLLWKEDQLYSGVVDLLQFLKIADVGGFWIFQYAGLILKPFISRFCTLSYQTMNCLHWLTVCLKKSCYLSFSIMEPNGGLYGMFHTFQLIDDSILSRLWP